MDKEEKKHEKKQAISEKDVMAAKEKRVNELLKSLSLEVEPLEKLNKRLAPGAIICWQGSSINAAV